MIASGPSRRGFPLFVLGAAAFFAVLWASPARAYPGPLNVNGTAGSGYISTVVLGGLGGACSGCHVGTTNPPYSLSITGNTTTQNDTLANLTVSYFIGDSSKQYGGFLIAHNDATTDDLGGKLGAGNDGGENACGPLDNPPCNGTTNNNTEIQHARPRLNSGGLVSFPFTYSPPAGKCGYFTFNVWANNVNGDANCGDTLDTPIEGSFGIQVNCPPATDACHQSICSAGTCVLQPLTGNGCNDFQSCTFNDTCTAGSCAGTPISCVSDQCNTRSCNGTSSCTVNSLTGTTCDDGQSCTVGDQCSAGVCAGTPTASCPTQRPDGSTCGANSQCANGHCVDGVCCNTACTGQCEACNLPAAAGVCSPVKGVPVAPRAVCVGDGTACSGTCNGVTTAACTFPATTKACRAATCTNDVGTLAANCDGKGKCPAPTTVQCDPYVCGQNACDATCSGNADCQTGFYCGAGKCVPLVTGGKACTTGSQCASGNCVDKVCCDTACTGQCQACNVTGKVGSCVTLVNAQPHAPKPACTTDGSACGGACDGTSPTECVYPGLSVSCRTPSCANGVATLGSDCNGTGKCPALETVTCGKACAGNLCDTKCASSQQCGFGSICSAGRCVPQFQNGEACTNSGECASSYCVDGVCCDSACGGQCEACNVTGNEGTCQAITGIPHGTRPACVGAGTTCGGSCNGTNRAICTYPGASKTCAAGKCTGDVATLPRICSGAGTCGPVQEQLCTPFACGATSCSGNCTTDANCSSDKYCSGGICRPKNPLGAPCAAPDQCTSGFCVDGLCCNRACAGECEACDDPLSTGTCKAISGPPHGARPPCGSSGLCGGKCDGQNAGKCFFPGDTTTCGNTACNGGFLATAPTCNGIGSCVGSTDAIDCSPFACAADGRSCAASCTTNADCAPGTACMGTSCVAVSIDAGSLDAAASDAAVEDAAVLVDAHPDVGMDATVPNGAGGATTQVDGGISGATGTGGRAGSAPDAGVVADAGSSADGGPAAAGSKDKGSCGCRFGAKTPGGDHVAWAGLAGLALIASRRRERSSRSSRLRMFRTAK